MGMKQFERFKLWMENGTDTGSMKQALIITAHGGRSLLGGRSVLTGFRKKKVPNGMALYFYGPDRATITSGTIKYEFIDHDLTAHVHKIKQAGQEYVDYQLTKFQGRHGNEDETYTTVQQCLTKYDVVTIRYRPLKLGSTYLSEVLATLQEQGYVYGRIHCSFCRSFNSIIADLVHGRSTHVTPT